MDYLYLALGLVVLVIGGEATLRGAVGLAQVLGVSAAIIGLTVMGFGTSAPELVVTVRAALDGNVDIGVGNIVGSNIANSLLILGVGALICPLFCDPRAVRRDGAIMVLAMVAFCILGLTGVIQQWQGGVMVASLVAFLVWSYFHDKKHHDPAAELHEDFAEETPGVSTNKLLITLYLIIGLAGLSYGADLMVNSAVRIAERAGLPQSIIGLTIVAFGTSLPELGATAIAAWRRHTDIAVASVLGSNIFNILGVLGVGALVTPLSIAPNIASLDQWIMLAATAVLMPVIISGWRIDRREGFVLFALYLAYVSSMTFRV
jgi:cation:H+ antiporter